MDSVGVWKTNADDHCDYLAESDTVNFGEFAQVHANGTPFTLDDAQTSALLEHVFGDNPVAFAVLAYSYWPTCRVEFLVAPPS